MTRSLLVFFDQRRVGRVWLDDRHRWLFQYDAAWVNDPESFQISTRMGLQETVFDPDVAKSFFVNLLPEGDVRQQIAAKFGISAGNDFALLAAIGGDCAGALSLHTEATASTVRGNYREITDAELSDLIRNMSRRPLLTADGKARLSLAGAQEKLPISYRGNTDFLIPENGAASSHILKPPMLHYEDSVHNEVFCMQLARKMGLQVPHVELLQLECGPVLVTERYDRKLNSDGTILRLHQEDFCQALGLMPDQKYQSEGGPSFEDCANMLLHGVAPVLDKQQIIGWVIFNYLVGNCDAHAKNISLLISAGGVRLAPFYDILSTVVYEGLSDKMAMKIGGHYERDKIFERHWVKLAGEMGVKPDFVVQQVHDYSKKLPTLAESSAKLFCAKFGGDKVVAKIVEIIKRVKIL